MVAFHMFDKRRGQSASKGVARVKPSLSFDRAESIIQASIRMELGLGAFEVSEKALGLQQASGDSTKHPCLTKDAANVEGGRSLWEPHLLICSLDTADNKHPQSQCAAGKEGLGMVGTEDEQVTDQNATRSILAVIGFGFVSCVLVSLLPIFFPYISICKGL